MQGALTYKIKFNNDDWSQEITTNLLSDKNTTEGNYTIQIIVKDKNGIWNNVADARMYTIDLSCGTGFGDVTSQNISFSSSIIDQLLQSLPGRLSLLPSAYAASCEAGYYYSSTCTICPAGSYCPGDDNL